MVANIFFFLTHITHMCNVRNRHFAYDKADIYSQEMDSWLVTMSDKI